MKNFSFTCDKNMLQCQREKNIFCYDIEFITLVSIIIAICIAYSVQCQSAAWRIPTNGAKKMKKSTTVKILLKDLIMKAFIIRIDTIMAYCNGWYQQQHWWLLIADFAYYVINRMTSSTFISVFISVPRHPFITLYVYFILNESKFNEMKYGEIFVQFISFNPQNSGNEIHHLTNRRRHIYWITS